MSPTLPPRKITLKKMLVLLMVVLSVGLTYWAFFSKNCQVNHIKLRANDELRWTGQCRLGKAHGKGLMTWVRNKKSYQQYRGAYRLGSKEGKGQYYWASGARYFGEYQDDMRHGKGTYIWPDKSQYVGQFYRGKKHGQGVFTKADGSRYIGQFLNDLPEGKGIEVMADGSRYEGQYRQGTKNGQGIQTFADYSRYEGDFVEGVRSGTGVQTWADGSSYRGDFLAGKRHGRGKMQWANGDVYEGDFVDDLKHGLGTYTWADKSQYVGSYDQDFKHGKGVLVWRDGTRYEGDFFEDKKSGKGVETDKKGTRYEGQFSHNFKHGLGKFKWADGTVYEGWFNRDVRHGNGTYIWPDGSQYTGQNRQDNFDGSGVLVLKRTNPEMLRYTNKGRWLDNDRYEVRGQWVLGEFGRSAVDNRLLAKSEPPLDKRGAPLVIDKKPVTKKQEYYATTIKPTTSTLGKMVGQQNTATLEDVGSLLSSGGHKVMNAKEGDKENVAVAGSREGSDNKDHKEPPLGLAKIIDHSHEDKITDVPIQKKPEIKVESKNPAKGNVFDADKPKVSLVKDEASKKGEVHEARREVKVTIRHNKDTTDAAVLGEGRTEKNTLKEGLKSEKISKVEKVDATNPTSQLKESKELNGDTPKSSVEHANKNPKTEKPIEKTIGKTQEAEGLHKNEIKAEKLEKKLDKPEKVEKIAIPIKVEKLDKSEKLESGTAQPLNGIENSIKK